MLGAATLTLAACISYVAAFDASCPSGSPHRTVILWTAPRCLSTAFERAIVNLEGVRIMHEPFGGPHYFGKERQSHRFDFLPNDPNETFSGILDALRPQESDFPFTFSKDMAYYLRNRTDVATALVEDPTVTHTFLIRHPAKTVPSLRHKSYGNEEGETSESTGEGWDHFDQREVGFVELVELFNMVKNATGKTPSVMDADMVLQEPEQMLQKYCEAAGLPYMEGMTSWTPGPVDGWQAWPGWHDDAIKSSGLIQRKVPKPPPTDDEIAAMPDKLRDAVKLSLPLYAELLEQAVLPSIAA
eukprot:gb/GFBE01019538.1/.p1 GENE.gb/GFBE01019538.1/~~gb/GFBE01019538.1/.p1  ORF type:complete len:300 (+),score=73.16 gb/GFBE01019538.1/:1-900(+)